jgi:hypothetical protein
MQIRTSSVHSTQKRMNSRIRSPDHFPHRTCHTLYQTLGIENRLLVEKPRNHSIPGRNMRSSVLQSVRTGTGAHLAFSQRLSEALFPPNVQGGSNMTGTNCDLFIHKSSRSYLNHLVKQAEPTVCWPNINTRVRYGTVRLQSVCCIIGKTEKHRFVCRRQPVPFP